MTLKSIEEHNKQRLEISRNRDSTGVACPNCENELKESSPGLFLPTSPMQKYVKCYNCGYETTIFA